MAAKVMILWTDEFFDHTSNRWLADCGRKTVSILDPHRVVPEDARGTAGEQRD
jgi:hypothetical protein